MPDVQLLVRPNEKKGNLLGYYVPEALAQTPATGECLVDMHWVTHPEHGLLFCCHRRARLDEYPYPQCNRSVEVTKRLLDKVYPGHVVRKVPIVYVAQARKMMAAARRAAEAGRRTDESAAGGQETSST